MPQLRTKYEQQLISLKLEVKDPIAAVSSLSNRELLLAINYYLHYLKCETWTSEELLSIEVQLNNETQSIRATGITEKYMKKV